MGGNSSKSYWPPKGPSPDSFGFNVGFFDWLAYWLSFEGRIKWELCGWACLILYFGFPAEIMIRIFVLEGTLDERWIMYWSIFPATFFHWFLFSTGQIKKGSGGPVFDEFNGGWMLLISVFIHILIEYACQRGDTKAAFIVVPFLIIFMILNAGLARIYRKLFSCPLEDENGNLIEPNYNIGYPIQQGIEIVGLGYLVFFMLEFLSMLFVEFPVIKTLVIPMATPPFVFVTWPIILILLIITGLMYIWDALQWIPGMQMAMVLLGYNVFLNMTENSKASEFDKLCTDDGVIWSGPNIARFFFALFLAIIINLFKGIVGTAIGMAVFIVYMVFEYKDD